MAVTKSIEVNNSNVIAEHWVLMSIALHRVETTNEMMLQGVYLLWKDKASYDAKKKPLVQVKGQVTLPSAIVGNPTVSELQELLDTQSLASGAGPGNPGGPLEGGVIVV